MLIRFSVSNYLSFDAEVSLSMVKGRTLKHPNHVIRGKGSKSDLLRAAVIYGANAAGKSNLVSAIDFARTLITGGVGPSSLIPLVPFKLRRGARDEPSVFEFEFRTRESDYIYGYEITTSEVKSEWLYKVGVKSQNKMFERTTVNGKASVEFGVRAMPKDDAEYANHVARGTRGNQLFLSECLRQAFTFFEDVYKWFDEDLIVIFPLSTYKPLEQRTSDERFRELIRSHLNAFDTGITGVHVAEVDFDEMRIPEDLRAHIVQSIGGDKSAQVQAANGQRFLVAVDEDGKIRATKLMLKHQSAEAEEVAFDIEEESDGTRRLMDLIPVLPGVLHARKVVIVDELDRSLHPAISRGFLELFLGQTASESGQLIATTHESGLLDLELMRRDELWFVEKDKNGASQLYSLEEFAPRYDRDIQKGYLLGRFGGIPMVRAAKSIESTFADVER